MTHEQFKETMRLAEEAVATAYRDGYRKGYRDGGEAAIAIMERNLGVTASTPKSLLKAVP